MRAGVRPPVLRATPRLKVGVIRGTGRGHRPKRGYLPQAVLWIFLLFPLCPLFAAEKRQGWPPLVWHEEGGGHPYFLRKRRRHNIGIAIGFPTSRPAGHLAHHEHTPGTP